MERHKLKQYIFALSTVSLLNSACQQLGSNRMRINFDNVSSSGHETAGDSRFGIENTCEQSNLYVHMCFSGVGKGRGDENQFDQFQQYEQKDNKEKGRDVIQITPRFRSERNRDFTFFIDEQVEGTYKEFGKTLVERLKERGWSREKIDKEGKNINLILTGHSQGGIAAFKFYQKYKHELNIKGLLLINTPLIRHSA